MYDREERNSGGSRTIISFAKLKSCCLAAGSQSVMISDSKSPADLNCRVMGNTYFINENILNEE